MMRRSGTGPPSGWRGGPPRQEGRPRPFNKHGNGAGYKPKFKILQPARHSGRIRSVVVR